MKRCLFLLFSLLIISHGNAQEFDKLIDHFKYNSFGWGRKVTDSINSSFLYRLNDHSVSISKNPIKITVDSLVILNPNVKQDFEDWEDRYINFPRSTSVIYDGNIISLFDDGRFVCHHLDGYQRNNILEESLNKKKIKYHWIIDNELYGIPQSFLSNGVYKWSGDKWKRSRVKIPVKDKSILFTDEHFIVYRLCNGEFGGTIYFYDRKTNETYFTKSNCAHTIEKKDKQYHVVANLGHMMGMSEIKTISDPTMLDKATQKDLKIDHGSLGYKAKSTAYEKQLDIFGIQLFSKFDIDNRELFLAHLDERTFLAEFIENDIKVVHPLFNNDKYTHDPITRKYGEYTLISMDFYGIGLEREVSLLVIKDNKITLLDWNESHNK
ncbi:hypothetical protein LY01_00251 [Nonlabens xylanidelens]|uniref:WG repeat protein n=1 Tax=Nonlabens xylanidelens TaxID=191564 RepID=A0A2S6IQI9_9FLAO|nr:hypothetical protein [Nonlabens xylanidelens]PPK96431.1 hypothetical protein LY01_00251 [Nonlabens xylanidelens]PQJ18153.1 hypothetical protein BST94_09105 [Nonlabens xylanidelens]